MSAVSPVRFPDSSSPDVMRRRAWWLVALNLLIPGSAQLIAGNRRLGKVGVSCTFIVWGLIVVGLLLYWLWPVAVYTLAANPTVLAVIQVVLVVLVVIWIIFTLDTLRLVRLVKVRPTARAFVAALAVVGLVGTAGVASYGAVVAGSARSAITTIFDSGEYTPPVDGRYNILLLGGDAGPDRVGLRPDSISVASVDAQTGATVLIGIPRNSEQIRFVKGSPLYGPFPQGYNCGDPCLINYLYTYGEEHPDLYPDAEKHGSLPGIEAMRDAAEGVLGLKVQYFVLIDMKGFSDLIDALGGITIDVPERTPLAAEVPGAKPFAWVEAGKQHLGGNTALWYARSRFNTTDYSRMSRQRDVQEAILREFTPANVLLKFQGVAEAGKQVVKTDIPSVMLGLFVDLASKSRKLPVTRLELVPPDFNPAHPDYDKIAQAVAAAIAKSTPTPQP
ncbi:LytR family transcriptional regulator [Terrimesophilobacter mesophilus]|uniref:LytR family transcriptional regulator n=2 Tax=Terrimesophilobacter mesophilus TaxID=433647 RepID=A0A4V3I9H8_9MICO|nr:LytR family transcriptional regulator [Terrimesophilobacter mesophilus]